MIKKIYIDDLIREGNDAKALQYLAKELYKKTLIGGTRKRLMDRVADKLKELEKENDNLKEIIINNAENIHIDKVKTLNL